MSGLLLSSKRGSLLGGVEDLAPFSWPFFSYKLDPVTIELAVNESMGCLQRHLVDLVSQLIADQWSDVTIQYAEVSSGVKQGQKRKIDSANLKLDVYPRHRLNDFRIGIQKRGTTDGEGFIAPTQHCDIFNQYGGPEVFVAGP